jgi:hypothetical protein
VNIFVFFDLGGRFSGEANSGILSGFNSDIGCEKFGEISGTSKFSVKFGGVCPFSGSGSIGFCKGMGSWVGFQTRFRIGYVGSLRILSS